MKHTKTPWYKQPRWLLMMVCIAVLLVFVVVRFDDFIHSFRALEHADYRVLAIGLLCVAGSILSATLAYYALSLRRPDFWQLFTVQWAGMFVNRLLPAGIGGLGLFMAYFLKRERSLSRATAIITANALLGFVAHMTLLAVAVVGFHAAVPDVSLPAIPSWLYVVGAGVLILLVIALRSYMGARIVSFGRDIQRAYAAYGRKPHKLLLGYCCALGNTGGHILALYAAMIALGVSLSPAVALVALTGGVAAATLTPTPGGIAGSEAGVTLVLVAYGVDPITALACAVGYRLVSYWLPLVPGFLALLVTQQKRYI